VRSAERSPTSPPKSSPKSGRLHACLSAKRTEANMQLNDDSMSLYSGYHDLLTFTCSPNYVTDVRPGL